MRRGLTPTRATRGTRDRGPTGPVRREPTGDESPRPGAAGKRIADPERTAKAPRRDRRNRSEARTTRPARHGTDAGNSQIREAHETHRRCVTSDGSSGENVSKTQPTTASRATKRPKNCAQHAANRTISTPDSRPHRHADRGRTGAADANDRARPRAKADPEAARTPSGNRHPVTRTRAVHDQPTHAETRGGPHPKRRGASAKSSAKRTPTDAESARHDTAGL